MDSPKIILESKRDMDQQTYSTLRKFFGKGQISSLDNKKVTLHDVEVLKDFDYSMTIEDQFDDSRHIEFRFKVFKLINNTYILYIRHDHKYYIEVKETIQEVKERYNWYIQMMIKFHKDLIHKRGRY